MLNGQRVDAIPDMLSGSGAEYRQRAANIREDLEILRTDIAQASDNLHSGLIELDTIIAELRNSLECIVKAFAANTERK